MLNIAAIIYSIQVALFLCVMAIGIYHVLYGAYAYKMGREYGLELPHIQRFFINSGIVLTSVMVLGMAVVLLGKFVTL